MTRYNGIYDKQTTEVNGREWWRARGDANADTGASLYWSDVKNRWTLEAPDTRWEAVETRQEEDYRIPRGVQEYFGLGTWTQLASDPSDESGHVAVTVSCVDTAHPTFDPTEQPSEDPSQQPTEVPTEEPTLPDVYKSILRKL